MRAFLTLGGRRHRVSVSLEGRHFTATVDGERFEGTLEPGRNAVQIGGRERSFQFTADGVTLDGKNRRVEWEPDLEASDESLPTGETRHEVRPMMPGRVVAVLVAPGDAVQKGQPLLVLEVMKMQNEVSARRAGTITAVCVKPGDSVTPNDVLLEIA